jgi:hypothetical protein
MTCSRVVPILLISAVSFAACGSGDSPTETDFAPAFGMGGAGQGQCVPFSATGTTTLNFSTFRFEGTAQVRIGSAEPVTAAVTTYLTGAVKRGAPDNGAQVVTTSHIFDLGGGDTFTTEDIARLVPTRTDGVVRLLSTLRIVSGTGAFAGVPQNPNPRIVGDQNGLMDFRGHPTATWSFSSKICGYDG